MKKSLLLFFSTLILALTLTGCTTGQKQAAGIGGGAVVGGVVGNAIGGGSAAGTIVGAGAGALGGYYLTK